MMVYVENTRSTSGAVGGAPDDDRGVLPEVDKEVRVQLRFPEGGAVLAYRTTAAIAHQLAVHLSRHGVCVTVDDKVNDQLPALPNTDTWAY